MKVLKCSEGKYSNTPETEAYCSRKSKYYMGTWIYKIGNNKNHLWTDLGSQMQNPPDKATFHDYNDTYDSKAASGFVSTFSQIMNQRTMVGAIRLAQMPTLWQDAKTFVDVGG